jgi:uncharacterized membrane protein YdfJ with MMPL/SSD domain
MEQLIEDLTRGKVSQVKVALASVAAALAVYGFDDDETLHVVAGAALAVVLALKFAVIRWWHGLGRLLPYLGITVFVLLALTWLTSAGCLGKD